MTEFTPLSGLMGGILIGLASFIMLLGAGRITGISGIFGGLLSPARGDIAWRGAFIGGLIAGGLLWQALTGSALPIDLQASWPVLLAAGLLVGFGTRLGSGCTSGHGVCGIGRLSPRSFVAVAVFMLSAVITTYVVRHVLGA